MSAATVATSSISSVRAAAHAWQPSTASHCWENCRWIVFHGVSGEPGDKWHMNQNAAWAAGEMIPMLYDWGNIAREASAHQRLFFQGSDVYASESADGDGD